MDDDLARASVEELLKKRPFLINNGRTNHVWQSAYLDQQNQLVTDRWPYPFIQMNSEDMVELKVNAGDLVEIYNDNGSTQAIVYPTASDLSCSRFRWSRCRTRQTGSGRPSWDRDESPRRSASSTASTDAASDRS